MRIGFERFYLIVIGLAWIVLSIFINRIRKKHFALTAPLGPPGGIPFKPPFSIEFLIRILRTMELLGIFSLFVAAAGPVFISSEMVWLNRGADILFVLDISPSMAGMDMDGASRFDASRRLLDDFARQRPSDAIGLAALGNDAALLIPPTVDRRIFSQRLGELSIGDLGDGTALGTGLALAAFHIRNSRAPRRAVVLITDGENNAGAVHPETAAQIVREQGSSLWVIGVGSSGEVPVDYVDPRTKVRRTGTFESRYDPDTLKAIARAGGGRFIAASTAESFSAAFAELSSGEMTIRRSGTVNKTEPFHAVFIILSVSLILLSRMVKRFFLGAYL